MSNPSCSRSTPSAEEHKSFQYTAELDILLLKAVVDIKPYGRRGSWEDVAKRFKEASKKTVTEKNVKDRTEFLLNKLQKGELELLRKSSSSTPELRGQRKKLLDKVKKDKKMAEEASLMRDSSSRGAGKSPKKILERDKNGEGRKNEGHEKLEFSRQERKPNREKSELEKQMENPRKRKIGEREKNEGDQELELRREELNLAREKFELEKQERMHRMQQEKQRDEMLKDLVNRLVK